MGKGCGTEGTGSSTEPQIGGKAGITAAVHQAFQHIPLHPRKAGLPQQQANPAQAFGEDRVIEIVQGGP